MQRIFFHSIFMLLISSTALHANGFLNMLYTTKTGQLLQYFITKPWLSSLAGWYTNRSISRLHIRSFIKQHNIDMQQAVKKNIHDYKTFNEFFTRELEPNARPISTAKNSVICPSDGKLRIATNINENTSLFVKNKNFSLSTFLQDKNLAEQLYGGTLFVIYLAPHDYHRFHFPYAGTAALARRIAGAYHSVNPLVYNIGLQPLHENERHIIKLYIGEKKTMVTFVPVGALCVGQITETYTPDIMYNKGDQMGYFSFGGSTIVMIFPKGSIQLTTPFDSLGDNEITVKMGAMLATLS